MTIPVTLNLPEDLYHRATGFANLLGKPVMDVLVETLTLSLAPIATQSRVMPSVDSLSDVEVLALSELRLLPQEDARLSELLGQQQEGLLTVTEQSELLGLMQIYQEGSLRKAQALRESVQRGLREPLSA